MVLCECGYEEGSLDCADEHPICLDSSGDDMHFGEESRRLEK